MKSKRMNFNDYMAGDNGPNDLHIVWQAKRGRMTRRTVEARAVGYGLPAGTGEAAWDAFIAARRGEDFHTALSPSEDEKPLVG